KNEYPKDVLLIGDSHAGHLTYFFNYVGSKEGWNVKLLNLNSDDEECKFPISAQGEIINNPVCLNNLEAIKKYKVVILSYYYDLYSADYPVFDRNNRDRYIHPDFYQQFYEFVKYLSKDKIVYVFSDVYTVSYHPKKYRQLSYFGLEKYIPGGKPIHKFEFSKESNEKIKNTIISLPNVYWVDITPYTPDVLVNGEFTYSDRDHITPFAAYLTAVNFEKERRLLPESVVKRLQGDLAPDQSVK
ncbi:SGNH hydrolase domain-containing protein, partial [Basilea psittacipulmonis]